MMLSEFKNIITERIHILRLSIKHNIQLEGVSILEKWGGVLSTTFYTIIYLMFVNVIFSNIQEFATYSKNEVFFLTFMTQVNFYLYYFWIAPNHDSLLSDIKSGNLDYILSKPLPSLFYVSTKKLSMISTIRDGIPPLIVVALQVNWNDLHFSTTSIIAGIIVFICGQIAVEVYNFLLTLPVFWLGEAENLRFLGQVFDQLHSIPYEGQPMLVKSIFTIFIPVLFAGVFPVSVFLNKSDPLISSIIAIVAAINVNDVIQQRFI